MNETHCFNCGVPSEEDYCLLCHPFRDMPEKELRTRLLAANLARESLEKERNRFEAEKLKIHETWVAERAARESAVKERDGMRCLTTQATIARSALIERDDLRAKLDEVNRHIALARLEAGCPDDDTLVEHCRELRAKLASVTAERDALSLANSEDIREAIKANDQEMLLKAITERDEARSKMAQYRADFETATAKAEPAQLRQDGVRQTKIGVMAVIQRNSGEILLGLKGRAFDQEFVGKWVTPGGRVNFNESLEAAILREVREETGLEVEIVCPLPPQEIIHENGHYVFFSYLVRPTFGEPIAGDDISEVRWFTQVELLTAALTPVSRAAIDAAMTSETEGKR